ncbi:MAG: hypothetical protein K2L54_05810 [Clostridiales bacterium]|nr:hypothetical protein [Clostridiales bacterium]
MTTKKKLMIYKILLFAFAFFVAFMPSTVSRSREVNSRVIVEIIGIDGGETVSVTAQYVMPTELQGATSKDTVTVEADTLVEAVEALNTALGRRAELGHCSMVIVGKDASAELLGELMTSTDVTADVYLSAAEDKASDLVGDLTDFMKKTGATDADFIAYGAQKAHVATNTLLGFLSDLGSASESAYIPLVEMIETEQSGQGGGASSGGEEGGQSQSAGGGESKSGGQGESEQTGMKVERLALYNKDGRAGILDNFAARGVAWVSAPIEKGIVTADVEYNGEQVKNVTGRLIRKLVDIKVEPYKATVKLKAYIEPNGDKFNKLDADKSEQSQTALKDGFAKKIAEEMQTAYKTALDMQCDPLFIGRQFYRYTPKFFGDKYLPYNINVEFKVEIVIR